MTTKPTAAKAGLLALAFSICGCEARMEFTTKASAEQNTGPVTVVDVSVGYCLPAVGEKSGTSVCDRTLTLKKDDGTIYQIGLERSGSWPPVWKGMRADIHFKPCEDCYPPGHASRILWVQELGR